MFGRNRYKWQLFILRIMRILMGNFQKLMFQSKILQLYGRSRAGILRKTSWNTEISQLHSIFSIFSSISTANPMQRTISMNFRKKLFILNRKKYWLKPWCKKAAFKVEELRARTTKHVIKTALFVFFVQLDSNTKNKIGVFDGKNQQQSRLCILKTWKM